MGFCLKEKKISNDFNLEIISNILEASKYHLFNFQDY